MAKFIVNNKKREDIVRGIKKDQNMKSPPPKTVYSNQPPPRKIKGTSYMNRNKVVSKGVQEIEEKKLIKISEIPEWFKKSSNSEISIIIPVVSLNIKNQIENWPVDDLNVEIIYVESKKSINLDGIILGAWKNKKNNVGKIIKCNLDIDFNTSCGLGLENATGNYIVILNENVIPKTNWLKEIIDFLKNNKKSVVSPQNCSYILQNDVFVKIDKKEITKSDYSYGCVAFEKEIIKKEYFPNTQNDNFTDISLRLKGLGYELYSIPTSDINNTHEPVVSDKWKEIIPVLSGDKNKINPNEMVVYTAITENYDYLKEQQPKCKNTEFIAFLENNRKTYTWEIKNLEKQYDDPNRNAKIYKILPHRFFPNKQYSLWIDGSVEILFPQEITRLAEIYLSKTNLAIFRHYTRNCLYQEANICMQKSLDNRDVIKKQIERYTQEGYPINNGLVEATIILRRHTQDVIDFCEKWWEEIKNGSKRDQISFNYVAWKLNFKYSFFPDNLARNNLFKRNPHAKK